jgi:non-canonical purine NTP pyrophosphatase (RdgB/HAM1 family)
MLDRIALITGNAGKAAEYAAMLGIEVTPAKAELTEIQSLDVADVAARKAADAFAQLGQPVLVDDAGLSIHAWNGLPGALVAWFIDTVGPQGILDMAQGLADRGATATAALGYADAAGVRVFQGTVDGSLATELRGTSGFGHQVTPRHLRRPVRPGLAEQPLQETPPRESRYDAAAADPAG